MRLLLLFLPLFVVLLTAGGCATLTVELEQRPYQGAMATSISYTQVDSSGTRFLRTVPAASVHTDRRLQAVKQSKYFWGLVDKAATAPVEYDWAESPQVRGLFSAMASFMRTELNLTNYYTAQPIRIAMGDPPTAERMETRAEALRRAGVSTDALTSRTMFLNDEVGATRYPRVDKSQLSRLTADISPLYTPLFRLLTLGMFWDAGYSTDAEVFGLRNKSSVSSWFGRGEFMITMDSGGNFFVREFRFDPTDTVRNAARLGRQAAVLTMKAQVAGDLLAAGQTSETLGLQDAELREFTAVLEAARKREQAARDASNAAKVGVAEAQGAVTGIRGTGATIAKGVAGRKAAVLGVIDTTLKTGLAPTQAPKTTTEAAVISGLAKTDDYVKLPELPKPK